MILIKPPCFHHSGLLSLHVWVAVIHSLSVSTGGTYLEEEAHSAGCTDWLSDDVSESSDWLVLAHQTHSYLEVQTAAYCLDPWLREGLGLKLARWEGWANMYDLRSDQAPQESYHSCKWEVHHEEALEDLRWTACLVGQQHWGAHIWHRM